MRKLGGFDFVGSDPMLTGYAASCEFNHPKKLKPGFHVTSTGMHIIRPPTALYMMDFDDGAFNRKDDITKEHLHLHTTYAIKDPHGKKICEVKSNLKCESNNLTVLAIRYK